MDSRFLVGQQERVLAEILEVLHVILSRLPKPPQYRPPIAIVVIPGTL